MWLLALAIFAGCKWQTWWDAPARHVASWQRSAAYLFLWPGMDAEEFLATDTARANVERREWLVPLFRTVAGALLIACAARFISVKHPLCAGWMGMLGIVLVLHFGIFDLISAAWRSAGIRAEPIMRQPRKSQSLGEFWGKRWNLGFRKLSHALVFRPLQKRFGVVAATLGAFLASEPDSRSGDFRSRPRRLWLADRVLFDPGMRRDRRTITNGKEAGLGPREPADGCGWHSSRLHRCSFFFIPGLRCG